MKTSRTPLHALALLVLASGCTVDAHDEPRPHPMNAEEVTADQVFRVGEEPMIISNGVVSLGLNPEGHLNVPGGELSSGRGPTTVVGLRYLFDHPEWGSGQWESLSHGCDCEGWGVANGGPEGEIAGYASGSQGLQNVEVESFTSEAPDRATSVVLVGDAFRITHAFRPAEQDDHLYEILVTIENTSGAEMTDVHYVRHFDWDIPPNPFYEYVTIQGTGVQMADDGPGIEITAHDDGFASPNPLVETSGINFDGDAVDDGPDDHGARFDFAIGSLGAGQTHQMRLFYGGAPDEDTALKALDAVGSSVYSLGQGSWDGESDPTVDFYQHGDHAALTGEPVTFIFGYAEAGDPCDEIEAMANALSDEAIFEGRTVFSREEYYLFYEAVACKTKVPAEFLKAYSFGEGLGSQYDDPYPRQFLQPCAQAFNQNGYQGYSQMFARYYGLDTPILAVDAECDGPGNGQGNANGVDPCSPTANITSYDEIKEVREYDKIGDYYYYPYHCDDMEGALDCGNSECTEPSPQAPGNGQGNNGNGVVTWPELWPSVSHVTLGDDRTKGSNSFGLGVAQVTFFIHDILEIDGVTWLKAPNDFQPDGDGEIRPLGDVANSPVEHRIPDQSGHMDRVIGDPQYNILLAAQLAVYKSQFAPSGTNPGFAESEPDPYYGIEVLRRGDAVPTTPESLCNHWLCNVGQIKANGEGCNGPTDEGKAQGYIRDVLTIAIDEDNHECFCDTLNDRLGESCVLPLAHAFAVGIPSEQFPAICAGDYADLPISSCYDTLAVIPE